MNTGGDAANIMAGFAAEIGKEGIRGLIKLGGELLKLLLLQILGKASDKDNKGKATLRKLIKSGEPLSMVELSKEDAKLLAKKATKAGIDVAYLDKKADKESGEDKYTIVFKTKDAEIINKMIEKMADDKMKGIKERVEDKILDDLVVQNIYFVDKDNPYNFVDAEFTVPDKFYIVDKDNPDNYIYISEKTIMAEVNINGQNKVYNDKNAAKQAVIEAAHHFKHPDMMHSKEEIEQFKSGKENNKKTMKGVNEEVKRVRKNQPSKEQKDKNKTREKGDR